jgi:tetratricopeptide (TPR) repeat protein
LQRALDIDRKFRAKYQINWELSGLGDLAYSEGQYSQMEQYFQECLVTSEKIGFRQPMVWSLHHLGVAARRQGQVEASLEFYRKSISLAQEFGFAQDILENLTGLAGLALERGHVTVAVKLLGLVAKHGLDGFGPITLAEFDRDCNAAREKLSEAEFQQTWEAGAQMTVEQALGFFQELAA